MNRIFPVLLGVAALLLVACGGTTKTVVETVTAPASGASAARATTAAPSTLTTAAGTTASGPPDCNAAGINSAQLKEGTCTSNGQTVVIVNKASSLHLKSLDANLVGTAAHDSLGSGTGQSATANGKFEILTVTLRNKLDSPQTWQNGQAILTLPTSATHNATYSEAFTAENGPDQNSCQWKAGGISSGPIQPGESITCDVIFDVPPSGSLTARGANLLIENFGESDTSNPTMPLGIVRTYH